MVGCNKLSLKGVRASAPWRRRESCFLHSYEATGRYWRGLQKAGLMRPWCGVRLVHSPWGAVRGDVMNVGSILDEQCTMRETITPRSEPSPCGPFMPGPGARMRCWAARASKRRSARAGRW